MTRKVVKRIVIALPVVLAAAFSSPWTSAWAHPEISPQTVNRYLSLAVLGEKLHVSYVLLFGLLPGAKKREQIDTDHDGKISQAEIDTETGRFTKSIGQLFDLTVDGKPAVLEPKAALDLGVDQAIGAAPLVAELYAALPLDRGEHRLLVNPGQDPPLLGETEIAIDVSPEWTLGASYQGAAGGDGQPVRSRFRLEGPRVSMFQDRSVTFVVRSRGASSMQAPPRWLIAVAVVVALGAALAAAVWRLRKKQRLAASAPASASASAAPPGT